MTLNYLKTLLFQAGLAQPSGVSSDGMDWIFFADSESSSVRRVSLKDGAVSNVAGGDRDPCNLFSYGDTDGQGVSAKLQHPLGVSHDSSNNILYIADSYNHKIKRAELTGKLYSVTTLVDGLSEPGGLCHDLSTNNIFIADTNNHSIKILNTDDNTLETFNITLTDDVDSPGKHDSEEVSEHDIDEAPGELIIRADLGLGAGDSLNTEARSTWSVSGGGDTWRGETSGHVTGDALRLSLTHDQLKTGDTARLDLKCRLYLCSDQGVCSMKNIKRKIILTAKTSGVGEISIKALL